jgi:aryl-alcohol dehydrogenase-like predicted oxidoreductase
MKYVRLGRTGLQVSRFALGCMSFGSPEAGQHSWTLAEDDAKPMIRAAVEAGINFFDTANTYSAGTSEEIIGRVLKEHTSRENIVIATKVYGRMRPGPNGAGLSRKVIMSEVEASLRRLGTDYIDLYQIHRWDPHTPIEETLEALHDLVRSGKVRYVGASSMYAWQFSKALYTADLRGWSRFVSMQPHYNLLYREEEREMLPLCEDQEIGVLPWSPQARGRLTRPWKEVSVRSENDEFGKKLYGSDDKPIVDAVERIAVDRGVTQAQVALAWLLRQPVVTAPIIGATKDRHITDAAASLELVLTDDECAALEQPYLVHAVAGH